MLKACWNGHVEVFETLIKKGCDPYEISASGMSPLHIAAAQGNVELTKLLVYKYHCLTKADFKDCSETPLEVALKRMFQCIHHLDCSSAEILLDIKNHAKVA